MCWFLKKKKQQRLTLISLSEAAMLIPVAFDRSSRLALAVELKEQLAAKAKAQHDAEAAYEAEQAAIPLTWYEIYYQRTWRFHNMTNGQLRQEIRWRPDPSSC